MVTEQKSVECINVFNRHACCGQDASALLHNKSMIYARAPMIKGNGAAADGMLDQPLSDTHQ